MSESNHDEGGAGLLPCPFCGDDRQEIHSEPMEGLSESDSDKVHWVECVRCAARGPLIDSLKDPKAEWQRRHHPRPSPDWAEKAAGEIWGYVDGYWQTVDSPREARRQIKSILLKHCPSSEKAGDITTQRALVLMIQPSPVPPSPDGGSALEGKGFWADFVHLDSGKMIPVVEGFETLDEAIALCEEIKQLRASTLSPQKVRELAEEICAEVRAYFQRRIQNKRADPLLVQIKAIINRVVGQA